MNLQLIDIIILIIIVASAIWGALKGFVRQIVSIIGLFLGAWCAYKFSAFFSAQIRDLFSLTIAQNTLHIIMFVVILIIVLIICNFLGKAIEGIIKLSMLGWLNRLLGFAFGAIKTIVILSLIVYVVNYLNSTWNLIPKETLNASKAYSFLANFAHNLFPYLQGILGK